MDAQTSIATILEFPTASVRAPWVPPHARPCTVDDVEFYSLKLIQHLCNVTCRPVTLWPSDRYGVRWAGREAWVTCGDGRTRQVPADAARGSMPLMTLAAAPLSRENREALSRLVRVPPNMVFRKTLLRADPMHGFRPLGACGVSEIDAMKSFQQARCSQFASMAAKPLAARSAFVRSG